MKKRILVEFDKATGNELENLSGVGIFKNGFAWTGNTWQTGFM